VEFFTLSLNLVETAQFTSFTWCVKLFAQLELIRDLWLNVFTFVTCCQSQYPEVEVFLLQKSSGNKIRGRYPSTVRWLW